MGKLNWRKYTILPPGRVITIVEEAMRINRDGIDGAIAEVGVYQGGMCMMLKELCPGRVVNAFDTFHGIPAVESIDCHKVGEFSGGKEAIDRLIQANVCVYKGTFPGTAYQNAFYTPFALAHYDGDTYRCCVDFIAWFKNRMVPGGVMIFDDVDWPKCPGVRKALDESKFKVEKTDQYQAIIRF